MTKNWFISLFALTAAAFSGIEIKKMYQISQFNDTKIYLLIAIFIASAYIYFKHFTKDRIKKK